MSELIDTISKAVGPGMCVVLACDGNTFRVTVGAPPALAAALNIDLGVNCDPDRSAHQNDSTISETQHRRT